MNENTTCNGWRNYPTWCMALWLSEYGFTIWDFGGLSFWKEAYSRNEAVQILSESLQNCVEGLEELNQLPTTGVFCDLLRYSLSQVDWFEIAQNWIDDISEEVC